MCFWSVNFTSWDFLSQQVLDMTIFYLRVFESFILVLALILANFINLEMTQFWSVNYIYHVCKLKPLFRTYLKFWTIFILIKVLIKKLFIDVQLWE